MTKISKKALLITGGVVLALIVIIGIVVGILLTTISAMGKMTEYSLGEDSFTAITGLVGERNLGTVNVEVHNGTTTKTYVYQSDNTRADLLQYEAYLLGEGGFIPLDGQLNDSGTSGTIQYGKASVEAGKVLLITIEFTPLNYTVIVQKGKGVLPGV